MIPSRIAAFCFVLLGAVSAQACGQGDGQVCQIDGDCASGLVCLCKVGTGARGLCRTPGSTMCSSGTDSGPNEIDAFVGPAVDTGPRDANVDTGPALDANTDADIDADTDAGSDAGSDAGMDASSDADVDANVDAP